MIVSYREDWDEEKWRGNFPTGPHPSCISAVHWAFFKGNLFLDISKTHLKAIFSPWLQPMPSASSPCASLTSSHVAPNVSQNPFLGSQHSFDLILRAICNPLQDTEARSTIPHLYIWQYLTFLSSALLGHCVFSSLSAVPLSSIQLPFSSFSPLRECQHVPYMQR